MPLQDKPLLTLIGAGPGDPELITIKAVKALAASDVILYDSLVERSVLDMANHSPYAQNKEPELVFVGKRRGKASLNQDEINKLILQYLSAGKNVSRLKGGDPFIFARGVEEIEYVNRHGYEARIIPGLSSGLALPALAGIALTLRNKSDAVTLATGHELSKQKFKTWANVLKSGSTLVVYMGLFHVVDICEELGLLTDFTMPAIAISNGSLDNEKIIYADLATLAQEIINGEMGSPAVLVIGKHIKQNLKINRNSIPASFAAIKHPVLIKP